MSKVFVCQEPMRIRRGKAVIEKDLSPAKEFGELVYVIKWRDTKKILSKADQLLWKIREALKDMTPEDYIIPIGDPTVIKLVGIVAAEKTDGRFRILQWDNHNFRYDVVAVDIHCQPIVESESV